MEHYKNPKNKGFVADNSYMTVHLNNPSCGDEITVQLKVKDNIIIEILHQGTGCSICCSSASVMSETLKNKTLDEAISILHEFYELIKGYTFNPEMLKSPELTRPARGCLLPRADNTCSPWLRRCSSGHSRQTAGSPP